MKFVILARVGRGLIAACLVLSCSSFQSQAGLIHLRNELIQTSPDNSFKAMKTGAAPETASGLFLIQFKGALSTEARAHLATLGVDLLSFIPENAFLARVRSVPLEQLAALPMVEWIGTYRPEDKLHQTLQGRLQSKTTPASGPLAVTVLLAPRANAPEIASRALRSKKNAR